LSGIERYNNNNKQEPQEKKDNRLDPYSLFVSQERTVTETLSMGEEELGCSEKKGKPELIHNGSQHTTADAPLATVGVRIEQETE
jgi:hypothetical protein